MKKIIIVCTQLEAGGAQRAALRLATYFKEKGFYCENWFLYKKRDVFKNDSDIKVIFSNQINSVGNLFIFLKELYSNLKSSKPDVIITFGHYSNIIAQFFALLAGIKLRIASHRNPRWGYMSTAQQVLDYFWARFGVYHEITAVSNSTKNSFANYPEKIFKKIHVIENGLELRPNVNLNKIEARKYFNLPESVFLIGNVGRLSEQKNQRVLIEAISILDNEVHLAIAGEGELRDGLEDYASELKISHRVHLIGEIEYAKIPIFFKAIDIFAMPSKFEGLSNALIEAMSFNLPVICSSIDAQKDVIMNDNGECSGILLGYDKPLLWAESIKDMKNDRIRYMELQKKAKIRSEDYQIEKMGKAFLSLVEDKGV